MNDSLGFLFFGPSEDSARAAVLAEVQNSYGYPESCEQAQSNLLELQKAEADLKAGYPTRVQERYIAAYDVVIPQLQDYITTFCTTAPDPVPGSGSAGSGSPVPTAAVSKNNTLLIVGVIAGIAYLIHKNKIHHGKGYSTKS